MKFKIGTTLLSIHLLTSCGHANQYKNLTGYPDFNGLNRYEDKEVVCYVFLKDDYPALWCTKK